MPVSQAFSRQSDKFWTREFKLEEVELNFNLREDIFGKMR